MVLKAMGKAINKTVTIGACGELMVASRSRWSMSAGSIRKMPARGQTRRG